MDGIFLRGPARQGHTHKKFPNRPASKAAIKRLVKEGHAAAIEIEGTSMFGTPYSGPLVDAPDGRYTFVGPDPYSKRDFYGTIIKTGTAITIS